MATSDYFFPVLMYHEILMSPIDVQKQNFMTPIYTIPSSSFERQLEIIKKKNLKTPLIENIDKQDIQLEGAVYLSFDDGCIGNYTAALPLLKKYGVKATFFVTTNLMNTDNYMNWQQVRMLASAGMSIQSHAMNHLHLTELNKKQIMSELIGSKEKIEDEISQPVTVLSFPHGSYNKLTIKCAVDAGYQIICTSDVRLNSAKLLNNSPVILGRIAMTTRMSDAYFAAIIESNKRTILKEQCKKGAKNLFKRFIGVENYGRLYRIYFNIRDE